MKYILQINHRRMVFTSQKMATDAFRILSKTQLIDFRDDESFKRGYETLLVEPELTLETMTDTQFKKWLAEKNAKKESLALPGPSLALEVES